MARTSRIGISRRRFLIGSAAAAVAWQFRGAIAWGQIPYEDERQSVMLSGRGRRSVENRFRLGEGSNHQEPTLAFDRTGRLHVAWIEDTPENGERVLHATFDEGGGFSETEVVNDGRSALHLAMTRAGDGVALAWVEKTSEEDWRVVAREIDARNAGESVVLAQGGACFHPALTEDDAGTLFAAWEQKAPGEDALSIRGSARRDGAWAAPAVMNPNRGLRRDSQRPALAAVPGGGAWLAYDTFDSEAVVGGKSGPNIYVRRVAADLAPADARQITAHPGSDIAPALAAMPNGDLWIAWQSNRRGEDEWDIPRWFMLNCLKADGTLMQPVSEPLDKDLDKRGTDQSFEFVRLIAAPDGGVIVTGRPSHNFCLQKYHGGEWSRVMRVPVDGWGGRGRFMHGAFDGDGNLWVARRDIFENVLQKITGLVNEERAAELVTVTGAAGAIPPLANVITKPKWEALEELEGIVEPLNYYYGDLHGHTWASDGVGDLDEWYFIRRDCYEDDFASLTDHDTFIRKSIFPTHYEYQKALTDHYNEDGRFSTLFGQEYTTGRYPRGVGHKCVFSTDKRVPLFDHMRDEYDTSEKLNAAAREWNALMGPHHTGWTGTDWDLNNDDVQPFAEIVSVHGCFEYQGNEPIPHRGGMRGHFLQDALAKGRKFGIIGGSDSHGLIWHHGMCRQRDPYRAGLAGVLAPELTREAIFDAIRRRRVFASTGNKPRIDFRVNGHLMGEEITAPAGEPVRILADCSGRELIRYITVVRDNEDWYKYGGEGWQSIVRVSDEDPAPGTHWYYLRVEYRDGNMAWSSPVWVTVG